MKYTVIVAGIPYQVEADVYAPKLQSDCVEFFRDTARERIKVAEFRQSKIDGLIEEDGNATN